MPRVAGTRIFSRAPVPSPGMRDKRYRLRAVKRPTVLLLASAVWLLGCQPKRDPNILLLVIDALRPDHLGCYGYALPTSPALDALARRGVLFADATSPSSYTRAAVPSIFASIHPAAHGVFSQGRQVEVLSDEYTTLAETLKARGYRTAAFMPNPSLHQAFNFDQGFDLYDDDFPAGDGPFHEAYETARRINDRTLRWLRSDRGKPFFAYLHYRDVHGPYSPPPPYDTLFPNPGTVRQLTREEFVAQPLDIRRPQRYRDLDSYIGQYDGEIRYTDDQIARLLETLEKEGFLENTVIFVTADHGEAFLEHGLWTHGTDVYEEQTRVPLLMVLPDGKHAGERVEAPVQTVDLYPSILALLDAEVPAELQGENLFEAIEGDADPQRPVFSEARVPKRKRFSGFGQLVAVRSGGWKLIYNRTRKSAELYHLAKDPGEKNNLIASQPDQARKLVRLLKAFDQDSARRSHRQKGQEQLPDDVIEGLRSLGYVQ
jgi:arylsulfatase A-like enzyme